MPELKKRDVAATGKMLSKLEKNPVAMARFVTKMVDVLQEFGIPEDTIDVRIPGMEIAPGRAIDPNQVGVVIISTSDSDKNSKSIVIGFKANDITSR